MDLEKAEKRKRAFQKSIPTLNGIYVLAGVFGMLVSRYNVGPEDGAAFGTVTFLASGDSFRTVAFSYRLGNATLQQ
uniref:Uncharacterized protein n=1 Tax=Timema poppense TaxID=170557 RepID=A0A7R9H909_TIMPO|nr:unnamed protein product [Timema poppensis]